MSGVLLPVTRPMGRALVVASPSSRPQVVDVMRRIGIDCCEADDPYTATLELCRHRLAYRALILSLSSLYREELAIITTAKRRFPHVEIWLTHTDGRQAALADAMRLGADGLLNEEGLHRIAAPIAQESPLTYRPLGPDVSAGAIPPVPQHGRGDQEAPSQPSDVSPFGEPVLTADELRALLQDQPAMPPSGAVENKE